MHVLLLIGRYLDYHSWYVRYCVNCPRHQVTVFLECECLHGASDCTVGDTLLLRLHEPQYFVLDVDIALDVAASAYENWKIQRVRYCGCRKVVGGGRDVLTAVVIDGVGVLG